MTLTVTDMFCGAGGTSTGATAAGLDVRLGLNHWQLACESFGVNHAGADVDCADVSGADPRRYPVTDVLLASPECTNHTGAKGVSRKSTAPSLLDSERARHARLAAERSRATMWDVVRFAEHHRYAAIVVENVVEAHDWTLWPSWWRALTSPAGDGGLGYAGQVVSLNSGILHLAGVTRVPQSRDRLYVVLTRDDQPAPDLTVRPHAACQPCGQTVAAVQSWRRPARPWGRYRRQYDYRCPRCAQLVAPSMAPAADAIDWTLPAPRIGGRTRPLAAATVARIRRGLARYGRLTEPNRAVPFVAELRGGGSAERAVTDPLATIVASGLHHGLAVPDPDALLIPYHRTSTAHDPAGPLATLTARDRYGLLVAPGGTWNDQPRDTAAPLATLTASEAWGLVTPLDRLGDTAKTPRGSERPLPTQTARNDAGLAIPADPRDLRSVEVEDCGFRMLQPDELAAGMGFPPGYQVLGSKRERVCQYGNAVTPPAAQHLTARVRDALDGHPR